MKTVWPNLRVCYGKGLQAYFYFVLSIVLFAIFNGIRILNVKSNESIPEYAVLWLARALKCNWVLTVAWITVVTWKEIAIRFVNSNIAMPECHALLIVIARKYILISNVQITDSGIKTCVSLSAADQM